MKEQKRGPKQLLTVQGKMLLNPYRTENRFVWCESPSLETVQCCIRIVSWMCQSKRKHGADTGAELHRCAAAFIYIHQLFFFPFFCAKQVIPAMM